MHYLDKSDTRLKLALQVTNSSMWEWNLLTGQVAWSKNFEQLFGLTPGTLNGTYKSLLQRICQGDRRLVIQTIARAIREKADYTIEFRIYYPDGSLHWLITQGEAYYDIEGMSVKVIGVCRDITSEKHLEVAQCRQENQGLESKVIEAGLSRGEQQFNHTLNSKVEHQTVEACRKERTAALEPVLEQLHSTYANSSPSSAQDIPHKSQNGEIECNSTRRRKKTLIEQAQAVIERSEAKWRSLVQHSSDLIIILSEDGTILYNNPSIERILGYSPEELVGQQGLNYIDPQDTAAIKKAWEIWLVAGSSATLSPIRFRALRKEGAWCILEATGTNLLADAAVEGIALSVRDATESFQVQDMLQQSEVRFRAIFENAALGIALSKPSGEVIASNPALYKMFGYEESELCKLTITHPDDGASDFNLYQALLYGSIPSYQMEKRYFHKNGNLVWGRLSVSLVRDRERNPLFAVSMVEDITVAKKTEAELLRISKAVENASDAIAICDTMLVRFTYINPAFCQMFGYTQEQINAAGGFSVLFSDPLRMHEVLEIALTGQSWQGEVEMITHSLARKQIALRLDAIKDITGEVVGTLAIHTDITQRKQAETALRRSYERAELLKQITSKIRSSLEPQHIFQTTVTQLGKALSVNRCMIFLYQEAPQPKMSLVAEYLEPGYSSIEAFEVPVEGNPHAQQVLASDKAIASPNVYEQPLLQSTAHLYRAMEIKSMLAVRTSYQASPNGVLGLQQCDSYRYWTSSEIELLEAVAAQVGIALSHARLLEKEKTTAAQLAEQNKALQISNTLANTKAAELEQALQDLQQTQAQLVQTEKMSSLGQLLAGVAHEINNPVSFITVNITYACDYIQDLLRVVNLYQQYYPQPNQEIQAELKAVDLDFIVKDLPKLLNSMKVGADRINQIVLSLRNFSRHDEVEMKPIDIHEGIDNTLMILRHRLKAKGGSPEVGVIKKYGTLPRVECYAGQLNQVFMNLISNAIDAIASRYNHNSPESERVGEPESGHPGELFNLGETPSPKIEICTETKENKWAVICIKDNGSGMTEEVKQKLFNPFFTTKPAGKGTGLGLSISYQIVVEKHGGQLKCISVPGQGTEFIIEIPIRHS